MTETSLGRDVLLEDGLVVVSAGKNWRVIWVQCPTCGPQPPATGWNKPRGTFATLYHDGGARGWRVQAPLICSVCGRDAPHKEILIPKPAIDLREKGSHEKCTGRCLDGKVFCACHCRGRCHSEGQCFCKEEVDV